MGDIGDYWKDERTKMTNLVDKYFAWAYRSERQWFWLREAIHFSVGAIIGGSARLFMLVGFKTGIIARVVIGCTLLAVIVCKEIFEDRVSQNRKKTFTDCISWILGYCAVVVWP